MTNYFSDFTASLAYRVATRPVFAGTSLFVPRPGGTLAGTLYMSRI